MRASRVAILVLLAAPVACSLFVDLSGLDDGGAASIAEAGTSDVLIVQESGADTSTNCGDTTKDPKNCGFCGHSCLGGTCTSGACDPVTITHAVAAIDSIACDESAVYFITDAETVIRKPIDATPATTLVAASISNVHTPFGIAVDATHVFYFSSVGGAQLTRVTKDAAASETIAAVPLTLQDMPESIAVDDASVYVSTFSFASDGGSRVMSFDNVPDASAKFLVTQYSDIEEVQTIDETLFFQGHQVLQSVPASGGNPTTLSSDSFRLATNESFGLNDMGAGWATVGGGAVEWRASDGQNVELLEAGSGVQGVAMDPTNFYAALIGADAGEPVGSIVAISLATGARTTVATGQTNPHLPVACPTYIAWLVDDGATTDVQILAR